MNENNLSLSKYVWSKTEIKIENKELLLNKFKGKYRGLVCAMILTFFGGALEKAGAGMKEIYTMDLFENNLVWSVPFKMFRDDEMLRVYFQKKKMNCNVSVIEKEWKRQIITARHCVEVNSMNDHSIDLRKDLEENGIDNVIEVHKRIIKDYLSAEGDLFIWDVERDNVSLEKNRNNKKIKIEEISTILSISPTLISELVWKKVVVLGGVNKDMCFVYLSQLIAVWQEEDKAVWTLVFWEEDLVNLPEFFSIANMESFRWLSGGVILDEKQEVLGVLSWFLDVKRIDRYAVIIVALIPDKYKK